MPIERRLIVNADDFGLSPGVNKGIIAAYEHGTVTSASLMVRWPAASDAAAYARAQSELAIGLHVDLGEWIHRDGAWRPLYEVVPLDNHDALAAEVRHQLSLFRRIVGRDPTHLDSHQHVHREGLLASMLLEEARRLGIPLRNRTPGIRYDGRFYGQTGKGEPLPDAIGVDALLGILATLPEGITELCCHPGLGNDVVSMYRSERQREVETLCDPQVRAMLEAESIRLCSSSHLSNPWQQMP